MTMFAVAYLVVWLAVVLYIARLARGQRHLTVEIESLRAQLESSGTGKRTRAGAKAA